MERKFVVCVKDGKNDIYFYSMLESEIPEFEIYNRGEGCGYILFAIEVEKFLSALYTLI